MKSGDAIALSLAIDSPTPREWFRKCGLHTVLQEKCWVVLWRNLIYKTSVLRMTFFPFHALTDFIHSYLFLEAQAPGGKVDGIPFSLLTTAFRFSYDVDDGWGPARIQSVVMSLVAQVSFLAHVVRIYTHIMMKGYIIGRVEGDTYLSLKPEGSKKERFPQFSNVRQTYPVQAVWGVSLK